MKELSLHLLDIVQNSISAGATRIEIQVVDSTRENKIEITVKDNGRGMAPAFLKTVTDAFTTTRTTRKVGLGLPLFKMAAEQAGGGLLIESEEGTGTVVTARFQRGHIDTPPLGDLAETVVTLVQGAPAIDFIYRLIRDEGVFSLDTLEIREVMGDVPLSEPEVLNWIREYIQQM